MIVKYLILVFLGVALSGALAAQSGGPVPCTGKGQTPASAFPVCGTDKFVQTSVSPCGVNSIDVPGCNTNGASYMDTNPYYYKFTCYASGTLGFLITPLDLGDDYDWQLWDVTLHQPNDIFINGSLFVSGNWSGSYGKTGADGVATAKVECASNPLTQKIPTFSHWPTLIKGHNYLLLVSHFTNSQSGYTLTFGGGTAIITDTVKPHMASVSYACNAQTLYVHMNKKMKCSSIAADGSDFKLLNGLSIIEQAIGANCSVSFDMDTLSLQLDKALPPGNYTLQIKNGTDNNTLLDNCSTPVIAGETIDFTIDPLQPTPFDSVAPVACSPDLLRLVFKKGIQCNSISPDGSDFKITGSLPVSIVGASGNCQNGISSTIDLKLSAPIVQQGNFQIALQMGLDGNTIIDECGQTTPAGGTVSFSTVDTVSAAFSYQILWGCDQDTVMFTNSGGPSINQWQWLFDTSGASDQQSPRQTYSVFGDKQVALIVSNGVCSDTASAIIPLDNTLTAAFEAPELLCPADLAPFVNKSIGHIQRYTWNLGDGFFDFSQQPRDHDYPSNPMADRTYTVQLVVEDDLGCRDTATHQLRKLHSCYIAVPNAFTPNGDGVNDYLYPLNAFKASNLQFRVYNRYGQLVFESHEWTNKWDGTVNGKPQGAASFVWTLQYTDNETNQKVVKKGVTTLIR